MKKFFFIIFANIYGLFISSYCVLAEVSVNSLNTDNIENYRDKNQKLDSEKKTSSSINNDDIFGDEQTFPFVAGLGKNAAH